MPDQLNILLIGSGGREHALAWKLAQSPQVSHVYVAPGNGGTASGIPKVENKPIQVDHHDRLISFAKAKRINLVVPGPEAPLVNGITDILKDAVPNLRVFGPSKAAAALEGSKTFSKNFMAKYNIPTARYKNFQDFAAAQEYIESLDHRVVIKATGLAAGKGVILPDHEGGVLAGLKSILVDRDFGDAGNEVVVEEYLEGDELSLLTFSDGYTLRTLPAAQDHKQIFDGDRGPNTGGMGAYAPAPIATPSLMADIQRTILQPTIDAMRKDEGIPFVGLLFTGLMITTSGPQVLEYNVRFGDPETQTLLPLLSEDTDLASLMVACCEGRLDGVPMAVKSEVSATVVAAAAGYPGYYQKGDVMQFEEEKACGRLFHAGTKCIGGEITTAGGRVIAANSTAASLAEALEQAYRTLASVTWPGKYNRTDIAHRALGARPNTAMTYAGAGVSIEAGNELVVRIKPAVKSTVRPGASAELGGFGGAFDLLAAGYSEPPILITGTDGVGTKLKIAQAVGKHDTIGIDLVAMNVNDLIVQGAEPLFFTDVYSCGRLDVETAVQVIGGICQGCKEANCALIGGETAEMAGLFTGDEYDVVGTATGAARPSYKLLPRKDEMQAGDVLLALASSGCHSNGFSLIRQIVEHSGLAWDSEAPWDCSVTLGTSLLSPTRIYVKSVLEACKQNMVKGMAHITGGGLTENIPRMLPKHLSANIDAASWTCPPVLSWLKRAGGVSSTEFARTFNTGIGMVLVVDASAKTVVMELLRLHGEQVFEIGQLAAGEGSCMISNMKVWDHTA